MFDIFVIFGAYIYNIILYFICFYINTKIKINKTQKRNKKCTKQHGGRARAARARPHVGCTFLLTFLMFVDFYLCIYIKTYKNIELYYKYRRRRRPDIRPDPAAPVPVPWRHGTLSEHEQTSYRTYGDLIYTVLKLVTRSTILDGSQHRVIVLDGQLWLDTRKYENYEFVKNKYVFFFPICLSIQGVTGAIWEGIQNPFRS